MTTTSTRRAAIYCRISKDTEGKGLGVERQETECRKLAEARGLDVVEPTFVDNDVSGYSGKHRPGFDRMVEALKAGRVDVIVTWAADRLTRQPRELEGLIDLLDATSAKVETVASGAYDLGTSAGRLQARIVGDVAVHESELKSERLKLMHAQRAERGNEPGARTPFGYRRTSTWLAVDLNGRGIPTRQGGAWSHSTIRRLLLNPALAGLRKHRGEVAGPGTWTPILTRETWEEVRLVLADPARKRARPAARYLLSGLLETPTGERLRGAPARGRRVYKNAHCTIAADAVEEIVVEAVLQRFDVHALVVTEGAADPTAAVVAIEAELVEAAEARGAGRITMAEFFAMRDGIEARLAEARAAVPPAARVDPLLSRPGALRAAWPGLAYEDQHRILRGAIRRVVVRPATSRGRTTRVDDRLKVDFT
jgi:site-specific DNA recombinase